MKIRIVATIAFALLLLLLPTASLIGEETTVILNTVVIEDFDEDPLTRWIARGSKFRTENEDENGSVQFRFPEVAEVTTFPTALFGFKKGNNENGNERKVLGGDRPRCGGRWEYRSDRHHL